MLTKKGRQKGAQTEWILLYKFLDSENASRETESRSVVLWRQREKQVTKRHKEPLRDDGNVYYFDSDDSFIGSYLC